MIEEQEEEEEEKEGEGERKEQKEKVMSDKEDSEMCCIRSKVIQQSAASQTSGRVYSGAPQNPMPMLYTECLSHNHFLKCINFSTIKVSQLNQLK
jgi:hypothetical protein